MYAENFILDDYLARIGFAGEPTATLETLQQLMRCQVFSVPFENLDVQAGKIVSLVPEDIVNKIVYQQRGGYCYEVNGLFAIALSAIGFTYELIGARPMFYPQRRPKTHMVLLVTIGEQCWLCDTGFGSYGLRATIGLHQANQIVQQDHERFLLQSLSTNEYVLQAQVKGEWVNQFGFNLHPMEWVDFIPANYFNSTHPDAIFVQRYLVLQQHLQGRTLLSGDQLKRLDANGETVEHVEPGQLDEVLLREFGLRRP